VRSFESMAANESRPTLPPSVRDGVTVATTAARELDVLHVTTGMNGVLMSESSSFSAWRHELEEVVRSSLDSASGLIVSSSSDKDRTTLTIERERTTRTSTRPERARARISTADTGWLLLDLDGQFKYRDLDYDPEGNREFLKILARLAEAYFAGKGREEVRRGIFGRSRREFPLELDGETYIFTEKA